MRQSGILMHVTSLPSPGGLGDLGREAYSFADFLADSGMRIWQVLPIGPVGYGESPYQSPSAFAGNPLLISPELLREEKLLDYDDGEIPRPEDPERADYEGAQACRMALLRRAFRQSGEKLAPEIEKFRREEKWAEDYALFSAVKAHFGGAMWTKWPDQGIRNRHFFALLKYQRMLREEIEFHLFCQYLFRKQWKALKEYCNGKGILLFGDMPIYVAEDSADTWTHPRIFELDRNRVPRRVAGVPPDAFSEYGQMWGNPLYRWKRLARHGFGWWVDRMKSTAELFDMVRVDHFIGFGHYYAIPYGAPDARTGRWEDGPGIPLFRALKKAVPGLKVVAEDLGAVKDQVRALMKWTGYPGMKVLCFAFDGDETNEHYPANITENTVLYTGTHDNDTVLGWARRVPEKTLAFAGKTLGFTKPEEAPAAFIRGAMASAAETVILPMQDILGLDNSCRMNYPGTVGGNWRWRMKKGADTEEIATKLRKLNRETGRERT